MPASQAEALNKYCLTSCKSQKVRNTVMLRTEISFLNLRYEILWFGSKVRKKHAYQSTSSTLWRWVYLPSLEKVRLGQWTKRLKSSMSPENLSARHTSYVHWWGPTEMTARQWEPTGSTQLGCHQSLHTFPYIAKIQRICMLTLFCLSSHSCFTIQRDRKSHLLKNKLHM